MSQATESTTRRTLFLRHMKRRRLLLICECLHRRSPFGFLHGFDSQKQANGKWIVNLEWGENPADYKAFCYARLTAWQGLKMTWLIIIGTIGRKVDEWQR